MIPKNELKYFASLNQKKVRFEEKKFIAEGKRLVEVGLNSTFVCEVVLLTESFQIKNPELPEAVRRNKIKLEFLKEKDFQKITDTKNPQGIAAIFRIPENQKFEPISPSLLVVLENITDPGNLGTIFRNCDWFGIKDVILSSNSVEAYNPKVVRSSMGSIFNLNIFETQNLPSIFQDLKKEKYQIVCTDMVGKNLYEFKPLERTALVFSNEAFGPTDSILQNADVTITIPRKGKAESLNVASASAVILAYFTNLST